MGSGGLRAIAQKLDVDALANAFIAISLENRRRLQAALSSCQCATGAETKAKDELLVVTYNLSFAVQKDWLFPGASEWWIVKEGREKYGGDQHHYETKSIEDRQFLQEWKISLCTAKAMEALAHLQVNGRTIDILGLQECNAVERPKSFHADPDVWKEGFGFTSSAIQYLDTLNTGVKAEPELSDWFEEPGLEAGSVISRPRTFRYKQLTYVRSTLYGTGSVVAVVYNQDIMGFHERIAEGECETESAVTANTLLAGRPYLILFFPKRNIIFISIHAPRTEDPATGKQSYTKEQYQGVYDRLGDKISSLMESHNPRVIMVGDFNDELHVASKKMEAQKYEYIEMALGGGETLTLKMPGLRDEPKHEVRSRDGYLPRTAAWPTMVKVETVSNPDGSEQDKFAAKYHPSGPKFSATIDLIFDSESDPADRNYHSSIGVPAAMDYEAQYESNRAPSEVPFADASWDQMNRRYFSWMSDHAPLYLDSSRS